MEIKKEQLLFLSAISFKIPYTLIDVKVENILMK